ncbi:CaiB/BaiF CoA-transferase family protein [Nocardioides sp. LHD-245]|uniref:CaiB/BaiF CoA transferase family protein n=1 Tax=Nocardioides sp. LHD-245 TaxID=3051387 RepID=UPI0027E07DDE|nr:CaiB/BaiF CoA-transferase family protein [Nocardioides sp. LHD-245]
MTSVLEGVRIIDAGTVLAVPAMTGILADFGADVVKIEHPTAGDPGRRYPPHSAEGQCLTSKVTNRNKRFLGLDLSRPEGREVLLDLVAGADAITLNYRLSTLRKWGIDYEDLSRVNPGIVVLHMTGFGRTGPYADRPAFSRIVEAYSGLTYATGDRDGRPMPAGAPIADHVAGVYGALSLMLALFHQRTTGRGQLIDLSLAESLIRVLDGYYVGYVETGYVPERSGTANPVIAPHDTYEFADGVWVQLPCSTQNMFERLCSILDLGHLVDDSRFRTNAERVAHRESLDGELVPRFAAMSSERFLALADEAGIAAARVNSAADLLGDEHAVARGILEEVYDENLGRLLQMQAVVPRLSVSPGAIRWPGREMGQDTDTLLAGLGYDAERIRALRDSGVV